MNTDPDAQSFHRFLVDAKTWWMSEMFSNLRREYEASAAGKSVTTPEQVRELLGNSNLYPFFAWLERHIQKTKYAGRRGLLAMAEAARADIEEGLQQIGGDLLTLDPNVAVPEYYAAIDTHQHPGNLTGDTLAGYVYEASAMSTQPGSTAGLSLHVRFANLLAKEGSFTHIADLGCGFGKSTLPLAQQFRNAEVVGLDLSAPCLQLAALRAAETQQQNVRYRQADAVATGCASDGFDLVTSTMLLHEMPPLVIEDLLKETYRLLQPGGVAVHLDFRAQDPFLRFLHHDHGFRNNEPYMEAFDRMDVVGLHERLGFEAVRVEPFAESDGTTAPAYPKWRLPWTVFIARKPPADDARSLA